MLVAPFSVIVPCYNEKDAIRAALEELEKALGEFEHYEIIVVDDGSTDGSSEVLEEMAAEDVRLRLVKHERNRGYGAALKTGIRHAEHALIAITDADGSYPASSMPQLLSEAAHADMVVGSRTGEDVEYPLLRRIPKLFMSRYVSWLVGRSVPDMNSGMRVFRRDVVERFLDLLPDGFSFTTTITVALLTSGYSIRYVPINYAERTGKSKIRPIRDTLNFSQLILRTGTYFAPMRVFFPVAMVLFACFAVSAAVDVFVLQDMTDKTVLLLLFAMNSAMFALLADLIDKRTKR